MNRRVALGAAAYLVPTFALGFVWHLVLFKGHYDALGMYRKDVIIPLGFLSMSVQSVLFSWLHGSIFAGLGGSAPRRTVAYAAFGAILSWSFTTLAVAAKNVMTSVPDYVLIETGFTLVQWALVAPLTALVTGTERGPASAAAPAE